jgi:hypothetical protein
MVVGAVVKRQKQKGPHLAGPLACVWLLFVYTPAHPWLRGLLLALLFRPMAATQTAEAAGMKKWLVAKVCMGPTTAHPRLARKREKVLIGTGYARRITGSGPSMSRRLSPGLDGISPFALPGVKACEDGHDVCRRLDKGIARYLADPDGLNPNAVVGPNGSPHTLTSWGAHVAFTHYWSNDGRSNLIYGIARIQPSSLSTTNDFHSSNDGASKPLCTRIQGSVQYSFIK